MRRFPTLLALVLVAGCATTEPEGPAAPTPHHVWEATLDRAIARSKAENRVLVIVFHAPVCPVCDKLERVAFEDPEVQRTIAPYICVEIDVNLDPDAVARYKIVRVPDVRFVDPDGGDAEALYSRAPGDIARRLREIAEVHGGHRRP